MVSSDEITGSLLEGKIGILSGSPWVADGGHGQPPHSSVGEPLDDTSTQTQNEARQSSDPDGSNALRPVALLSKEVNGCYGQEI